MGDLADRVGVSAQSISRYEANQVAPPTQVVRRIALALGFPYAFFSGREIDDLEMNDARFRKRSRIPKYAQNRVTAAAAIGSEVVFPALACRVRAQTVDIPDLGGIAPTAAARLVRDLWNANDRPFGSLVPLLEARGVIAFFDAVPEEHRVDGVSWWRSERPFLLLNQGAPGERQQYTLAHELGHLVLHQDSPITPEQEAEADAFAAEFLMPASQFASELPTRLALGALLEMKRRWHVSAQAMIRRGFQLGRYNEWQYRNAFKRLSINGWRKSEPNALPAQESRWLPAAFRYLGSTGLRRSSLAFSLGLPDDEFNLLVGAHQGPAEDDAHRRPSRASVLKTGDRAGLGRTPNPAGQASLAASLLGQNAFQRDGQWWRASAAEVAKERGPARGV